VLRVDEKPHIQAPGPAGASSELHQLRGLPTAVITGTAITAPAGVLRPVHLLQMMSQSLDRGVPLAWLQERERGLFVLALLKLNQRRRVVRPGDAQQRSAYVFVFAHGTHPSDVAVILGFL
jgi:hypothetical protein